MKWRYHFDQKIKDDTPLVGFDHSVSDLSKDQEEKAEVAGVSFLRDGGSVPSRFFVGDQIQVAIMQQSLTLRDQKWGRLTASSGQFIVADHYDDHLILPVFPHVILAAGFEDSEIDCKTVADFNGLSAKNATRFYFAKDFQNCPISDGSGVFTTRRPPDPTPPTR